MADVEQLAGELSARWTEREVFAEFHAAHVARDLAVGRHVDSFDEFADRAGRFALRELGQLRDLVGGFDTAAIEAAFAKEFDWLWD